MSDNNEKKIALSIKIPSNIKIGRVIGKGGLNLKQIYSLTNINLIVKDGILFGYSSTGDIDIMRCKEQVEKLFKSIDKSRQDCRYGLDCNRNKCEFKHPVCHAEFRGRSKNRAL